MMMIVVTAYITTVSFLTRLNPRTYFDSKHSNKTFSNLSIQCAWASENRVCGWKVLYRDYALLPSVNFLLTFIGAGR